MAKRTSKRNEKEVGGKFLVTCVIKARVRRLERELSLKLSTLRPSGKELREEGVALDNMVSLVMLAKAPVPLGNGSHAGAGGVNGR